MDVTTTPVLEGVNDVREFVGQVTSGQVKKHIDGGWIAVIRRLDGAIARYLLENGITNNRTLKHHHIRNLVEAMDDGVFHPVLVSVKLDRHGRLADGQHRLIALRAAGVTLEDVSLVILADDEALSYVDDGSITRSQTDTQKIAGKIPMRPTIIGAVTLERNNFKYSERQANRIKVKAAEESQFLPLLLEIYKKNTGTISGVFAAATRCARVDRQAARDFFLALVDTSNTKSNVRGVHSVEIVKLREKLKELKDKKVRGFQRQWFSGAYCITAFAAWFHDRNITRLKLPGEGKFPSFGQAQWAKQAQRDQWFLRKPDVNVRINAETKWYKTHLKAISKAA